MLRFLFPRLTPQPSRASALFDAMVREARQPHWFVEGGMEDSLDGRFAVLATVTALAIVRLERGGSAAHDASVGLTERFVEAMDSEHRQLGIGDPTLGKKVRKLTASLGRRVGLWREAIDQKGSWKKAAGDSLRLAPDQPGLAHLADSLRQLWARLEKISDEELVEGRTG